MSINKSALRIDARDEEQTPAETSVAKTAAVETVDPRMKAEIASYIFQMTGEMTSMARAARLDLLAYFLEMARIEASGQRQQT